MLSDNQQEDVRLARWYFGGLAGSGAACFTHPLDLIKVHLQTQHQGKLSIVGSSLQIVRHQGALALYSGLTASLLRQMTYSTARFGAYEVFKQSFSTPSEPLSFAKKIGFAAIAGAFGGVLGTPADMVNVRYCVHPCLHPTSPACPGGAGCKMMSSYPQSPVGRCVCSSYKNALDGLIKVYRLEGPVQLFSGCMMATSRAVLMTVGQISFYDQIRQMLLETPYFTDNVITHLTASLCAGGIATTFTMPLDVLKTRMMNAKPGEYKSILHCFLLTAKLGPAGFYKGFIPAFVRLAPHTCLTFVFFEQLRLNFGFRPATLHL
ncbi:SLC25A10 [Cordylochernes scorpioides]|uniref:SLC25A10 n=1 Tax=Cordylochernes scorpioides TaxID=51811 RepID=A0ABY6LQT9_9ARAC|nr:SLC25A10 [Cordylochernes scorpioides]